MMANQIKIQLFPKWKQFNKKEIEKLKEQMAYQKITDLFIATLTDYNPKSVDAYEFFKIVQIFNG